MKQKKLTLEGNSLKVWTEIKNLPLSLFGFEHATVETFFKPKIKLERGLIITSEAPAALSLLEDLLEKHTVKDEFGDKVPKYEVKRNNKSDVLVQYFA